MSVFGALLARADAKALAFACAVGWFANASLGLAIVLLVQRAGGSFAVAGGAVAALSLGAGALAPVRGRLVDRHGGRALLAFAVVQSAALLILLIGALAGSPALLAILAAAGAGAAAPPLIAAARARWPRVAGDRLIRTAHALNALLGDLASVLGPAAVGGFALLWGPAAAFGVVGVCPLAAAGLIARVGGGAGRVRSPGDGSCHGAARESPARCSVLRGNPGMLTVLGCDALLGVLLGAVEVVGPAFAGSEGSTALAAVPLAAFAAGSVVSSLWSGRRGRAGTPQRRFLAGFALLAIVLPLCACARSVAALATVLAAGGAGYGLLNVALLELLDELVEPARAVEAFTWLTTAQGAGIALGASVAGALATTSPDRALTVIALVAPLGALLAFARRGTLP
ncbi:MFS transporter [Conexibacter sp. CPCC 206217]|uniref:MFS transporter n=1 Tax=Conexibacter sp. CPCC 206217 TaxID=3064574 RepID=UPI0027232498|nr:MFS transporter [Conexibacter sp. CPCC 206217]MDO8210493.1 hypothetical protein [Conexibacter sp. CPCC 206217]